MDLIKLQKARLEAAKAWGTALAAAMKARDSVVEIEQMFRQAQSQGLTNPDYAPLTSEDARVYTRMALGLIPTGNTYKGCLSLLEYVTRNPAQAKTKPDPDKV